MKTIDLKMIYQCAEENITTFNDRRISELNTITLFDILQEQNPYWFTAKNINMVYDVITFMLDSHMSIIEETYLDNWLKGLAILISEMVYDGKKSNIPNIDFEFDTNGIHYLVSIVAGLDRESSIQSQKKQSDDFKTAILTWKTNNPALDVVAIIGCFYGKNDRMSKDAYNKYCGKEFWEFISGSPSLYTDILGPIHNLFNNKDDFYLQDFAKMQNKLTVEFVKSFCNSDYSINWNKIVEFNSGKQPQS